MVCSLGSGRMAVIARLLAAERLSQTRAEEIDHRKAAAEYVFRELRDADEANLLDEEDMHVYGLRPMSDPLQLVCCNACKKPIQASQYAAHAELYAASMMDGTGFNPGNRDHPASAMQPPTKRHKLIAGGHLPLPESPAMESGVIRSAGFAAKSTCKGGDVLENTVFEHEDPNHKNFRPVQEQHLTRRDVPAPLATKVYYSQSNNRLRAALRHLYFQESSNESSTDIASPKPSNEMIAFHDSHHMDPSFGQKDNDKIECQLPNLSSAQSPNHILAKSSDMCMSKAEDLPTSSLSNQLVVNVSRPAAPSLSLTRSSFLPKPYSFASNTGNPMGAIQQPKGSVPVK